MSTVHRIDATGCGLSSSYPAQVVKDGKCIVKMQPKQQPTAAFDLGTLQRKQSASCRKGKSCF